MKKTKVHLVPSTHWDREWYRPFRRYQTRLVRCIDKILALLEREDYPFFLLDGQTVMLDDYLEIKPENRGRLESAVSAGKLVVGPWYTVPDTLIPNGESLVKNLQLGLERVRAFGGEQSCGYTPDSFGIASQLSQIFCQFGLKSAMYTRAQRLEGNLTGKSEVLLASPDGSSLPAEFEHYNLGVCLTVPTVWRNFAHMKVDGDFAERAVRATLAYQDARTDFRTRMWLVGIDHMEPRENLPELVRHLNAVFPEIEFEISHPARFFEELHDEIGSWENLTLAPGEQRGAFREHYELGNTLSSRSDLKIQHRRTEDLLQRYVQPIVALEREKCSERLDGRRILDVAYRLLAQSQAHDSICTCSVDETSEDVRVRLRHARELGEEILKNDLDLLGERVGFGSDGGILIFNPSAHPRTEVVEGKTFVPFRIAGDSVFRADGTLIAGSEVEKIFEKRIDIETSKMICYEEIARDQTRDLFLEGSTDDDVYTGIRYAFLAEDIPPFGYRCFRIGKGTAEFSRIETKPRVVENETLRLQVIENETLRLQVGGDGSFDLFDKRSGRERKGLHWIEEIGDEGDGYTFSPCGIPKTSIGRIAEVSEPVSDRNGSRIRVGYRLPVPANLDVRRMDECSQVMEAESVFWLRSGSRTVEIETTLFNQVPDHRVRVGFRAESDAREVVSDTAFDLVARPIFDRGELGPKNIMTMPCRNLVYVPGKSGYALFSDSAQEYESWREDRDVVTMLTLLRGVGRVYRTDLLTKDETGMGSGTRWFSEDLQMRGTHVFRYGISPDIEDGAAACLDRATDFVLPLCVHGVRGGGDLPGVSEGIEVSGAVCSMLGRTSGGELFLRLFNASEHGSEVFVKGAEILREVRIDETEIRKFAPAERFVLAPKRVTTLVIREKSLQIY